MRKIREVLRLRLGQDHPYKNMWRKKPLSGSTETFAPSAPHIVERHIIRFGLTRFAGVVRDQP